MFEPRHSARVATAVTVNARSRHSRRKAKRTSRTSVSMTVSRAKRDESRSRTGGARRKFRDRSESALRLDRGTTDHDGPMAPADDPGATATARVRRRLIPFLFLLYVVAYLDRVNV